MPETILIKGVYPYEIPDYNEEIHGEILFSDKPKEDQFWVKTPHPKKFSSKKDEMDWVWREERRLIYGLFFMNNGQMTYINGLHYEYMQYYDNGFDVDFWEEHRLYCYFLEFSKKLPTNWGDFTIKCRRAGVTQIHNVDVIRTARQYNRYCGLMSTDLEKVKSVQFKPIRNALSKYPKQFRPIFKTSGGRLPERQIEFINEKADDERNFLGGWIKPLATSPTAFDGEKLHQLKVDEVLKFMAVRPMTIITPQLKAMKLQHTGEIIGKCSMFSTMGTDDKGMKYAIQEGQSLWDGSNYDELNEAGWTASGFIRYFMSCYDIMEIDRYGFPNREVAQIKQESVLNQIIDKHGEGSIEHIRELRENPRTIDDVFNSPKLGTTFNRDGRISARKIAVRNTPIAQRPYKTGKFIEGVDGNVYFSTNEEYKDYGWYISLDVIANPNPCKKYGVVWKLPTDPEGVVGYDPVKLDETTSTKISDPAIVIYKKNDHHAKSGVTNEIIGVYVGRKEDNDEVSEQCALAGRYYGYWLSPERNVGEKWFKRNGYNEMVVNSPYDGYKGILMLKSKDKNVLRDGIELIYNYLKKPQKEGDSDYLETIWFEVLLSELESFESDALNTHDIIAALIQCFIVSNKIIKDTAIGYQRSVYSVYSAIT